MERGRRRRRRGGESPEPLMFPQGRQMKGRREEKGDKVGERKVYVPSIYRTHNLLQTSSSGSTDYNYMLWHGKFALWLRVFVVALLPFSKTFICIRYGFC